MPLEADVFYAVMQLKSTRRGVLCLLARAALRFVTFKYVDRGRGSTSVLPNSC